MKIEIFGDQMKWLIFLEVSKAKETGFIQDKGLYF